MNISSLISLLLTFLLSTLTHAETQLRQTQQVNIQPFIVNGRASDPDARPYAVYVYGSKYVCTGTIIAPKYVITAAHCLHDDAPMINIVAGLKDMTKRDTEGQTIRISRSIPHPGYIKTTQGIVNNDIAVLELVNSVTAPAAKSVLLSNPDRSDESVPDTFVVAGFGVKFASTNATSSTLLETKMTSASTEECSLIISGRRSTSLFGDSHFCTLVDDSASGPCFGDSGGPLVKETSDGDILVGATSLGVEGCGNVGHPNIFASIANARDFIDSNSEGHVWNDGNNSAPKLPSSPSDTGVNSSSDCGAKCLSRVFWQLQLTFVICVASFIAIG